MRPAEKKFREPPDLALGRIASGCRRLFTGMDPLVAVRHRWSLRAPARPPGAPTRSLAPAPAERAAERVPLPRAGVDVSVGTRCRRADAIAAPT